ncbi:hypothetical protein LXL04_002507 [Taraxacum kok-saghyz]
MALLLLSHLPIHVVYHVKDLIIFSRKILIEIKAPTKKPKRPEKHYVVDSDSDEDDTDLSFLDCSKETFVPPPNLLEDPFLNLLCDEKMLLRSIDAMGDEQNRPDVNQADHAHMDEENEQILVAWLLAP